MTQIPVLIVGGGVVGLTASLFLAQQGVRSILVEKHPGTSIHPRARGVNGRTMELLRELGLEEQVRVAGQKIAASVGIYRGSTLQEVLAAKGEGNWLLRRIRQRGVKGQGNKKSPTGPCRCTQDDLEPVLLQAARERGVDARFSTEFKSLRQDLGGIFIETFNRVTGEKEEIQAQYLIAADGAKSPIRTLLNISQSGPGTLTHQLNIYFRADLTSMVKGREFSMCHIENPSVRGLLVSINNSDLWVFHAPFYPDKGEKTEDFPKERCIELIRSAIGDKSLSIEIKGILPWQSAVRVADQYQVGRVFLAGDAAHIMPPWGGFGANTGIQDAHNLAWKISAVLDGRAGPQLLSTYEAERRPIAVTVGGIAGSMNDERGLMKIEWRFGFLGMLWNMRRVFPYLNVGYGYSSSAIALEIGAPPGPGTTELKGRPGTRAPHLWVEREGKQISTLDLFGRGFVLLAGEEGDSWHRAAQSISQNVAGFLESFQMGQAIKDKKKWCVAFGVNPDGACLIRPDGFVAWRSKGRVAEPEKTLREALSKILAKS